MKRGHPARGRWPFDVNSEWRIWRDTEIAYWNAIAAISKLVLPGGQVALSHLRFPRSPGSFPIRCASYAVSSYIWNRNTLRVVLEGGWEIRRLPYLRRRFHAPPKRILSRNAQLYLLAQFSGAVIIRGKLASYVIRLDTVEYIASGRIAWLVFWRCRRIAVGRSAEFSNFDIITPDLRYTKDLHIVDKDIEIQQLYYVCREWFIRVDPTHFGVCR